MQRSVPRGRLALPRNTCEISTQEAVMIHRLRIAFTAVAMISASAPAADFRFDTVHTQLEFCVSHMGYSHSCGHAPVKSGFFHFDADDWSNARVDATIDVAALDMGNAAWSDKVRSTFLDAAHYPTAHFVGKRVDKGDPNSGIVVHGELTLRDRTRPVDLHVTFNRAGMDGYTLHYVAGFSATATFKRSAFGVDRDLPDVGDEVNVRIEVEGLRDKDAPVQSGKDDKEP
jgi:polyisoprenoid-binding protein YceI